jgi:hypothetical protein
LPAACGGGDPVPALGQVVARGTLTLSTDLRYPPQSFAVKRAKRAPGSRCPANQLTAPQVAATTPTPANSWRRPYVNVADNRGAGSSLGGSAAALLQRHSLPGQAGHDADQFRLDA